MKRRSPEIFVQRAAIAVICYFYSFSAATYLPAGVTRARDLGVPFDGIPGKLDAITDVRGVEVGHTTLVEGEGKLVVGQGPVRTGVTAILPLGKDNSNTAVPAAVLSV